MQICYAVTNPVVIKAGLELLVLLCVKPRPPLPGLKTSQLRKIMEKMRLFK